MRERIACVVYSKSIFCGNIREPGAHHPWESACAHDSKYIESAKKQSGIILWVLSSSTSKLKQVINRAQVVCGASITLSKKLIFTLVGAVKNIFHNILDRPLDQGWKILGQFGELFVINMSYWPTFRSLLVLRKEVVEGLEAIFLRKTLSPEKKFIPIDRIDGASAIFVARYAWGNALFHM
ncbi:hypothetical protein HAX54_032781, partial [Datura stramonium]|nr:hypothetical protein [Datura stramonium]